MDAKELDWVGDPAQKTGKSASKWYHNKLKKIHAYIFYFICSFYNGILSLFSPPSCTSSFVCLFLGYFNLAP